MRADPNIPADPDVPADSNVPADPDAPDGRPATPGRMFSRSELLGGGLPARRASTILFTIEGTAARLAAASRINRASYAGERTAAQREQQFLQAVSAGAALTEKVSIADIERFAEAWASLVPPDPDVRAAIARLLGAKHRFRRRDVPGVRRALGLDDEATAAAYQRLHGAALQAVFADHLPLGARLRWSVARLNARFDRLPPFWIAYFIALTETLGEGIMAVPLALAGLGPVPGVVLLLVLGAINLLTVAALTESVSRSGSMRYGTAYFGRLVRELLGRLPSRAMNGALGLFNVLTLFVYLLGFASVLAGATGVAMGLWIALLFAIIVVVLRKETLDDTIASAAIIGTINVLLVVAITAIAFLHVDPANLAYANVPLLNGAPIDATIVGLAFGVVLVAYFGHTAAANASKMVLTLEPTGRALLWGNIASLATIIVLYCAASVAFLGVLGPTPLLETNGTAITPLGDAVGPIIHVLGSIYVILAIGIGSLYVALGLYNQVLELLPGPAEAKDGTSLLARIARTRRGRLLFGFAPAAAVCLVLELVVLAGQDSFAGPIAAAGVLLVPLVTGVFPLLLVVAARRKAEYVPQAVLRIVGHPVVVGGGLVLFILAVALHGLVIWEGPVERVAALAVAAGTVVLLWRVWRSDVLAGRAIVELRRDRRQDRTTISVTGAGRVLVPEAPLEATAATAKLPAGAWRELRVWPHEVTADGWSVPLAARLDVETAAARASHVVPPSDEPFVIPLDGSPSTVQVTLAEASGA